MAWIAIDAGTSIIKSVAFSADGHELALARAKTNLLHPRPGFSEQSMEEVWQAICRTVRECAEMCGEAIEGLVTTAQGDGCWLVDSDGRPVRDAILWNDARAHAVVEEWRSRGIITEGFRISGCVTYAGLANAIAAWLSKEEPVSLQRAAWILSCNGWIASRMTGRFVADLSDGSNPYGDVRNEEYSAELLRFYNRQQDASLLPRIAKHADLKAPLIAEAAQQMSLRSSIPVVMAPYDIVSTAYGCGASSVGQACVILGTTLCPEVITDDVDLTLEPAGTTIALGENRFLRAMPTLTGCEVIEWAARAMGCDSLHTLEQLAAESISSVTLPYFLPYLSLAGERAPFLAPEASGSFHGMTLTTSRNDIARSVYEGLSFVVCECLQISSPRLNEVRVTGGGAKSNLWCQMIADVTGLTVLRPEGNEQGARGAFLFSQAIEQGVPLSQILDQMPLATTSFAPHKDKRALSQERFETWKRLRSATSPAWPDLRGTR